VKQYTLFSLHNTQKSAFYYDFTYIYLCKLISNKSRAKKPVYIFIFEIIFVNLFFKDRYIKIKGMLFALK